MLVKTRSGVAIALLLGASAVVNAAGLGKLTRSDTTLPPYPSRKWRLPFGDFAKSGKLPRTAKPKKAT